jgi:hypothetical protein
MAKRKRERVGGSGDHGDDDDDDPTCGLRQILPVANLPIDFDGEPMDGLQYLFTVRYILSYRFAEGSDGLTFTGEMHGGYPTSSTLTIPMLVVSRSHLHPLSNHAPKTRKVSKLPRRSRVQNGVANSSVVFVTSAV